MKKSSSNNIISTAVINSNIKRFMPVIFLGIIYFFFLYVFPCFFTVDIDMFLRGELDYSMMGVRLYCASMPLITSLALFNFLHKKNAVLFHHSIPVKRSQMYVSLVLAGIILINIPLILLGVYVSAVLNIGIALKVIVFGFIASTFVFSICTLAGIITGTTVMHFIVACWFNFLPQSIYFVLTSFGEGLLNGYSNEDAMGLIKIMSLETHHFEIASYKSLVYLASAIVILVLAGVLYKKLKLERSENAIVFTSLKIILNIIVSIYFMALLGLVVYSFNNTTLSFIIGSAIGAILGVYLGYMIFNKTFRIFNAKTLKLAIILVIVSMMLSLAFVYDIFGYENRIPNINEIRSVKIDSSIVERVISDNKEMDSFKGRDNISNVVKIHKRCVSLGKTNSNFDEEIEYINISYKLKNGDSIQREYRIPINDSVVNNHYKYIFDSKEFKEKMLFELILPSIDYIEVNDNETGEVYTISGREIVEFVKILDKDIIEMSYNELLKQDSKYSICVYNKKHNQIRSLNIFSVDENTIKYIKSKMG